MSYLLKDEPAAFSSAHGDLVYVVHDTVKASSPSFPNFKYVADVYVNGDMVVRLKMFPDPVNNFGIFNIGNIVRNYVNSDMSNPDFSNIESDILDNYAALVHVKFGNEYGAIVTTYTNLIESDETNFYSYYTGRIISQGENLSGYYGSFATTRPLHTYVMSDSTINLLPLFPNDTTFTLYVATYTAGGTLIESTNSVISSITADKISVLNVSQSVLADTYSISFANAAYYTVRIVPDDEPPAWVDKTYRFDLVCEPRYDVYTLHFLNRLGGYESQCFAKRSRQSIDISRKDYTKLKYTIGSNGVVSYLNGNVVNDDKTTYYGTFKEKLELNTNWLTEDQLTWLSELVKSPVVYIQDGNFLVPFNITDQSFEFKQRASDRQFNLKITGEYGDIKNVQYR